MSILILIDRRHDLTENRALAMRQEYAESDPVSISEDVVQWQKVRYGSDLDRAEFNQRADEHQIFEIITQMLWERREYGYPWARFRGFLVPLSK